jgi:hypothetical protein
MSEDKISNELMKQRLKDELWKCWDATMKLLLEDGIEPEKALEITGSLTKKMVPIWKAGRLPTEAEADQIWAEIWEEMVAKGVIDATEQFKRGGKDELPGNK